MEEKKETPKLKCPNELNVTVKKDNGETVVNEDCCTSIVVLLKNSGDIATSFLGVHNKNIIKCLDRATKRYFKILKKTLKSIESQEEEMSLVSEDLPEDMKLTGNGLETEHDKKLAEEEKGKKELQNNKLTNSTKLTATKSKEKNGERKTTKSNKDKSN
jgi:hypothetical protein